VQGSKQQISKSSGSDLVSQNGLAVSRVTESCRHHRQSVLSSHPSHLAVDEFPSPCSLSGSTVYQGLVAYVRGSSDKEVWTDEKYIINNARGHATSDLVPWFTFIEDVPLTIYHQKERSAVTGISAVSRPCIHSDTRCLGRPASQRRLSPVLEYRVSPFRTRCSVS
jgi:hypothetical protein